MALKLPPKSKCTAADYLEVERQLKALIAFQPGVTSSYKFYEELDAWLGPWGEAGYLIGYGKRYNIAFTTDERLNAYDHPVTRKWVKETTVNLQVAILRFVLTRVKAGNLAVLDEPTLREAAFASHPKAYLDAGLRDVAREEVDSIPTIIMIPYAEFNPSNPNFKATINQVIDVVTEPGVLAWLSDLSSGIVHWPIAKLESTLGEFFAYADWEIKKLYGYPGFFY